MNSVDTHGNAMGRKVDKTVMNLQTLQCIQGFIALCCESRISRRKFEKLGGV